MTAGHHLETFTAGSGECREQPSELAARERVSGGVCNHRLTASRPYPLYRLVQAGPLPGDESRLSLDEKLAEHGADVGSVAIIHQKSRKVCAAYQAAVGQRTRAFERAGITRGIESTPDLHCTPVAKRLQSRQAVDQLHVFGVDTQTDDMDRRRIPGHGDLNPGDEPETQSRGLRSGFIEPRERIVIGQRHNAHTGRLGAAHQLGGGQGTVGRRRMGMQVVLRIHPGILPADAGPQRPPGHRAHVLTSGRMRLPPVDLVYLRDQLAEVVALLQDRWESSAVADESADAPRLLGDAAAQLFDMLSLSARDEALSGMQHAETTTLGEYGMHLFNELAEIATRLELREMQNHIELLNLPFALWIARHGGEIRDLGPAVNALARLANRATEPQTMSALYTHCCELIEAASPACEEEKPGAKQPHPWRMLLLNRAIVATRSHNPDLMVAAFDAIVEQLPGEARRFFSEGMEQMGIIDYPDHVREVMQSYYLACARPRRLH